MRGSIPHRVHHGVSQIYRDRHSRAYGKMCLLWRVVRERFQRRLRGKQASKIHNSVVILICYHQDQDYVAFKDRSPVAEHHILVTPRIHVGMSRSPSEAQGWTITWAFIVSHSDREGHVSSGYPYAYVCSQFALHPSHESPR